mmetsp:Transcript_41184/g.129859  ORF Transcript_41184/g.129859 Transcript_41184/m.129859 type:complete len:321 (-) Transcript_41184:12-974(-)
MWLDLHHGECVALHADGLAQRRRHQKGEGREAYLRLAGEGGAPRKVGAALHEARRLELEQQRPVGRRVPHGNVKAARRRHRRLLRAASGHELARDMQVAHAAPQVDGAICIVGPRGDGAQPLEAFVDEGDGHGERVRARARLVAQRVVDRAVGCGGVEAQRQHVRRGEVGLARLWPVDEVGEGEARLAALVEDSVRPAAPVAARSASQDVLEALEVVGRARRFELGDDCVDAARESGVELLVADPQEAVHAERRSDRLAHQQLVPREAAAGTRSSSRCTRSGRSPSARAERYPTCRHRLLPRPWLAPRPLPLPLLPLFAG